MKKTDVFKKTILWIVILLFGIGLLSIGGYYGYRYWCINQIQNYYISLTRVSKFDDFSKMQGDFEMVVNLYRKYQADIMNAEIQCLLIDVNDGVSSAGVYERILEGTRVKHFELNEDEKKAINTVVLAFHECSPTYLTSVFMINDEDMIFVGEDGYYAIVYSTHDNPSKADIEGYMGKNAGIVKLSNGWYQVGRV